MNSEPTFTAPRIQPNLARAFGGMVRLSLYRLTAPGQWRLPLGIFFLVAVLSFAMVRRGNPDSFIHWVTAAYLTFLLPMLAFINGGSSIRDDMRRNAVDYVLTRPIPRWAFLVFRFVAQWISVQLSYLVILGGIYSIGLFRDIPELASTFPYVFVAQILALTVFLAFGFLCGTLTSRYLVLGVVYGGIVEIGISRIPIQLSQLSMMRHVRAIVHSLQPFSWTDLLGTESATAGATTLLAFTAVLLLLTAGLFARRELISGRAGES